MVALSPDGTLAYINESRYRNCFGHRYCEQLVHRYHQRRKSFYGVVFIRTAVMPTCERRRHSSVISTTTNSVTDTVSVGEAVGIAISPDGSKLYVSHYESSDTVTAIDTSTNAVTGTINVGNLPEYLAILRLDTDANEQAALSLTVNGGVPIGALIAGAVPFTVGGLEADDSGTVAFSDGSHAPVVVNIVNGVPVVSTANLSGLTDGPITATLHLNNDAAGNSFTNVVASATLDQDINDQPTVTLAGLTGGNAVEGTAVTATVSADDLPSSGITYAWQVSHDGGTTWTPIPGATSNSYTPTELDEGGQLQVQVSFTDPAGNNETGTATVLNVVDAAPTLSVSIISNHIAYTTIDPPGSRYTIANSINASRQIVGLYQDSNGQQHWLPRQRRYLHDNRSPRKH